MRMTCKVRRPDLMLEDQDEQKLLSVTCRVRTKRIRQKNTLKKYKSTNNCLTNYKKKTSRIYGESCSNVYWIFRRWNNSEKTLGTCSIKKKYSKLWTKCKKIFYGKANP